MSEIETYIAVEQFFGGGGLFGWPQDWEKSWGFSYLRGVASEAMSLRRRHIKGLAGATRRRALAAGLMGSAPPRFVHPWERVARSLIVCSCRP